MAQTIQQPAQTMAQPTAQPVQPVAGQAQPVEGKKSKWWLWAIIAIVVIGLIAGGLYFLLG